MVPQESHCTRNDPPKSSWGTTITTIQATRRFSHQRATSGAITVNGDPERSCISTPPSPRFSQRDATMLHWNFMPYTLLEARTSGKLFTSLLTRAFHYSILVAWVEFLKTKIRNERSKKIGHSYQLNFSENM